MKAVCATNKINQTVTKMKIFSDNKNKLLKMH